MTARTMPAAKAPPKPPGRIARTAQRHKRRILHHARSYLLALATAMIVTILTRSLWPLGATAAGCAAIAADRYIEHRWFHRSGGRSAARRRRRYQGMARPGELSLSVSLAAVRHSCKHLRPSLGGRTRLLPADEAGIELGQIRRTR
jgi:hypothetical protein